MNLMQYRGSRYADPDFDAYAMLHPPSSYRTNRTSLTQYAASANSDNPASAGQDNQQSQQQQQQHNTPTGMGTRASRNRKQKQQNGPAGAGNKSALAKLQADEAALAQRKTNVSRFGSTWLRPPGITKTYQAMMDEAAEREEQEAQARRELALAEEHRAAREAQLAAQRTARRRRAAQGGAAGDDVDGADDGAMDIDVEDVNGVLGLVEDDEEGQERDLDDEVPEAEEVHFDDSDHEENDNTNNEDNEDTGGDDNETRDNDDYGSEVEDIDAGGGHLREPSEHGFSLGALDSPRGDEDEEFGLDRDLDNSIPSAGSYQHTDTDMEDSSSLGDEHGGGAGRGGESRAGTVSINLTASMNALFPPSPSQFHPTLDPAQTLAQPPPLPTATNPAGVPMSNALNPPQILDGTTGRFVHSIEGTADFVPVGEPAADEGNTTALDLLDPDMSFGGSSFLLSSPAGAAQRMRRGLNDYSPRRSRDAFS